VCPTDNSLVAGVTIGRWCDVYLRTFSELDVDQRPASGIIRKLNNNRFRRGYCCRFHMSYLQLQAYPCMCQDTGYILAYRYIVQLSAINLGVFISRRRPDKTALLKQTVFPYMSLPFSCQDNVRRAQSGGRSFSKIILRIIAGPGPIILIRPCQRHQLQRRLQHL
jgi:hypothetical protein